ncbi:D-3-phosphoglycerate dehydrogenase [Sinobacterium norvegicum]|uniref:D-3-phosphoglycerate dehydrogenase n=1 Tax=Sinobacterium norvegicum TaxID=1641715 RepID=A0ABN8EG67_9GAMM|nr:phosphoglycerate dehydrogenase [Sinobacterium norvegicum]CAH0990165.1 D-3-phosphoglycerate dehydrogenase [Sinobacterium norvegicum]
MKTIRTYNQISVKGLDRLLAAGYEVAEKTEQPDALMLRSYKMQVEDILPTVKAIGRAGAGVNNIPLEACTGRGIPVFNAPGANANAVKELVLAGMLLSSRGILQGIDYVSTLDRSLDEKAMNVLLEAEKKRFKGNELAGKTIGIIGLGAIGSKIADMALSLGMSVLGYDPAISVEAAWRLPSEVERIESISSVLARADFVTLHLPVLDATRNLINRDTLAACRPETVLLNFSRKEIVDSAAVAEALNNKVFAQYVADFPVPELIGLPGCLLMPHIGASTDEAEDNCAIMVAEQLKDFLEHGNVVNAVNFPALKMPRDNGAFRMTITNHNVPTMLGSITTVLAQANLNVIDLLNKSRGEIAYNIIDLADKPSAQVVADLQAIDGVINIRLL